MEGAKHRLKILSQVAAEGQKIDPKNLPLRGGEKHKAPFQKKDRSPKILLENLMEETHKVTRCSENCRMSCL
jgi:hypothetical protein